jgi:hypothetical protein
MSAQANVRDREMRDARRVDADQGGVIRQELEAGRPRVGFAREIAFSKTLCFKTLRGPH